MYISLLLIYVNIYAVVIFSHVKVFGVYEYTYVSH